MSSVGRDLLRRLAPPVCPIEIGTATPRGADPECGAIDGFAALLADADGIDTGRAVDCAAEAGPFDPDTMQRFGRALDFAEARGHARVALLWKGRAFLSAVPERRIERELLARAELDVAETDAVIRVRAADEPAPPPLAGPPRAIAMPPGVLAALDPAARDDVGHAVR